ncbi:hypothetical protein XELAEV_18030294mg [Xenopus laevis]|uniref:Uncharacterized protein n=1 Tax=Xenopus laevis TaxID=8355 RepID=A0A974CVA1_XENLA|nr:hypothetical protein XELAEV_18030294mg [Xenopus laevis]
MDKSGAPSIELVDTGHRYQWAGYFAENLTVQEKLLLIPCGACGGELCWGITEIEGSCVNCQRNHYLGPFYLDQLPPSVVEVDRLVKQLKLQPPPVLLAEPQLLLFTRQLPPDPAAHSTRSIPVPSAVTLAAAQVIKPVEDDQVVHEAEEIISAAVVVSMPEVSAAPKTESVAPAQSLIIPSTTPDSFRDTSESPWQEDWEQKYADTVCGAPAGYSASGTGSCSVLPSSCSPTAISVNEDTTLPSEATDFWVLPGEAPPREFRAISKDRLRVVARTYSSVYTCEKCVQTCSRATDVKSDDGKTIEKPHPAYYTSHAITKHCFHRIVYVVYIFFF